MTVFLVVGRFMVAVIGMVTAPLPQLKVMTPPEVTAALSALNVQLAAVPVPTTVVGFETSAGFPFVGTPALQEPLGLPAVPMVAASDAVVLASRGVVAASWPLPTAPPPPWPGPSVDDPFAPAPQPRHSKKGNTKAREMRMRPSDRRNASRHLIGIFDTPPYIRPLDPRLDGHGGPQPRAKSTEIWARR